MDPKLFRLRWQHYLLAVLVYLVLLLAWAPASLLAWALPRFTQQAAWLEHAEGSAWRGQATGMTVRAGTGPALQLGRVNWQLRPQDLFAGRLGYRLKLEGAGIDAVGVLRAGAKDTELQAVRAELPAKWLEQLSPDLGLWQPRGRLVFETSHLTINHAEGFNGQATLRWLDAASGRVRPPLGNYRANIEGAENTVELKLTTESGPLFLQGTGKWSHQRGWAFDGTARAAPERRAELDGLLSLIGPAQADGGRVIRINRNR